MKYCIGAYKGGSGKSTVAIHLAVGLSRRGQRVLFVDLDHQGNSTKYFTGTKRHDLNLAPGLMMLATAHDIKKATQYERIEILPGGTELASIASKLAAPDELGREMRLKMLIAPVAHQYDSVVVDLPPERGTVSYNGLLACDRFVLPCGGAVWDMDGTLDMLKAIERIGSIYGFAPHARVLLSKQSRSKVAKEVEKHLRSIIGGKMFSVAIPENAKVPEAVFNRQTVWERVPSHPTAQAYTSFINEVVKNDIQTSVA